MESAGEDHSTLVSSLAGAYTHRVSVVARLLPRLACSARGPTCYGFTVRMIRATIPMLLLAGVVATACAFGTDVPAASIAATDACDVRPTLRPLPAQPVTHRGPSFPVDQVVSPTSDKPQSKLWYNDGSWWAVMLDATDDSAMIYELLADHTWRRTDALVDARVDARADVLSDGDALYVASGHRTLSLRILRYSYDSDSRTYSLDGGFPVSIDGFDTSSVVIAKDGVDRLWVTFASRPAPEDGKTVWVAASARDHHTWGEPFVLPVGDASPVIGALSAVVAIEGHVGVFWSTERSDRFNFAIHRDRAALDEWTLETPLEGEGMVDNHVNLTADASGRVFAAIKTARNDSGESADPLTMLLVRDIDGSWEQITVGTVAERPTRPFVLLDEVNGYVYVFATEGGDLVYKIASLQSPISFVGAAIDFVSEPDTTIRYGTSSKHSVTPDTGIVILGSGDDGHYYHAELELPGAATPGSQKAKTCPPSEL